MAEPFETAFAVKSKRQAIADAVAGAVLHGRSRTGRNGASAGHGAVSGRTSMPTF